MENELIIKNISFQETNSYQEAVDLTTGYNNTLLISDLPQYKRSPISLNSNPYIQNTSDVSGMAAALSAAIRCNAKKLNVLDIGGALGGHYATFRKMAGSQFDLSWSIVETPTQVAHGVSYIRDPSVKFFEDISETDNDIFDIVIMSGVLQYLPDPFSVIDSEKVRMSKFIVANRTFICPCKTERSYAQFVEYDKGSVSYPARGFEWENLKNFIERTHRINLFWTNPHETHSSDKGTNFTSIGLQAINLSQ